MCHVTCPGCPSIKSLEAAGAGRLQSHSLWPLTCGSGSLLPPCTSPATSWKKPEFEISPSLQRHGAYFLPPTLPGRLRLRARDHAACTDTFANVTYVCCHSSRVSQAFGLRTQPVCLVCFPSVSARRAFTTLSGSRCNLPILENGILSVLLLLQDSVFCTLLVCSWMGAMKPEDANQFLEPIISDSNASHGITLPWIGWLCTNSTQLYLLLHLSSCGQFLIPLLF